MIVFLVRQTCIVKKEYINPFGNSQGSIVMWVHNIYCGLFPGHSIPENFMRKL